MSKAPKGGEVGLNSSGCVGSAPPKQASMALLVLALLVGLPGNLFVVWTVVFRLRQRSVTAILILQLALADALVLLTAPLFLRQLAMHGAWEFGEWACQLAHYWCGVNMYTSVYLVVLMSLDRLLGVARPLLSHTMRSKACLWPAVLGVWVTALVLALPSAFYHRLEQPCQGSQSPGGSVCTVHHPSPSHALLQYSLEAGAAFLLPFSILACSYCCIMRQLAQSQARWKRPRGHTSILIALILGAFLLVWAPYCLLNLLQVSALLARAQHLVGQCEKARRVLIALAFLSSSFNPLLYSCAGSTLSGPFSRNCLTRLLDSHAHSLRQPHSQAQLSLRSQKSRKVKEKEEEVEEERGMSVHESETQ
ncbi:hypothetical protein JZ751_027171 [Albula glossodonta]|uniref:G-protein coupled receptors family 1 profile domain-containing protein n=1 Tax=Albula glossodonta TaxID=121402 RepID=A0A8T2MPU7_9TELE|nr:hypothetical protein JZ751_027171 [Albula glossodonta]